MTTTTDGSSAIKETQPAANIRVLDQPQQTTGLTRADLDILRKPFQPREHEFLKGLAYITESAITTRLEDVDPNWTFEILTTLNRDAQISVIARMTLKGVSRDGVGMQPIVVGKDGKEYGESEKAAATDAMKRCARLFGVGRYLLDLEDVNDQASLAAWLKKNYGAPQTPQSFASDQSRRVTSWADDSEALAKYDAWLTRQDMTRDSAAGLTGKSHRDYTDGKAACEAVKAAIEAKRPTQTLQDDTPDGTPEPAQPEQIFAVKDVTVNMTKKNQKQVWFNGENVKASIMLYKLKDLIEATMPNVYKRIHDLEVGESWDVASDFMMGELTAGYVVDGNFKNVTSLTEAATA